MRTKRAIKIFLSDSIPEILIIFLGLFRIKFFLEYLGSETLGLYQLYGQLFMYLALAEAGFTTASLYSLYKPIASNDKDKINQLLSGTNRIFKIIGSIMILIGIVLSFFVTFFIKEYTFSTFFIQSTFLLFLILNVIHYFFTPHVILYDAEQKKYIPNFIQQIGLIIKTSTEIILLLLGFDLYNILITSIFIILITNIIIRKKSLYDHPWLNLKSKKDFGMWDGTKHLIVHKIGGIVANNIDIVLVAKFLGLSQVVIYSAYNYILNVVVKLIGKITVSLNSIIGNALITDSDDKKYSIFLELNSFMFFIATIICSSLLFSITPFINIFYGNEVVAGQIVMILFVLILFYRIIRLTCGIYSNSGGLFKQTKICTISESVINLTLSLILVRFLGMSGLLLSTIISYIFADFILKPRIIHKWIFKKGAGSYYFNCSKYFIIFIFVALLNIYLFSPRVEINNLITWFSFSSLIFIINTVITFICYIIINQLDSFKRVIKILRKEEKGEV